MAVKPFHAIGLFPSKGTSGMKWVKLFEFEAVVCGYHYDGKWVSVENQELDCLHEVDNPDYYFTINSFESARVKIVGHMPMEMSRPNVEQLSKRHCRPPTVEKLFLYKMGWKCQVEFLFQCR